ncbi:MAG: glycoside hydrolase family 95-like protein, partial [Burkholderiales bacterium]
GLRARGGLKVGLTWRHGTLAEVRLQSMTRTSVRVRYRTESIVVALEPGKLLKVDASRLLPLASGKAAFGVH